MAAVLEALTELMPSSPWLVIVAAATPSFLSGAWIFYRWWIDRHDNAEKAELTAEERKMVEFEQQRASFTKIQQDFFDRLRDENVELTKDKNHGWNFARRCEARMHKLYHAMTNLQQSVNDLRIRLQMAPIDWPKELPLPTDQDEGHD